MSDVLPKALPGGTTSLVDNSTHNFVGGTNNTIIQGSTKADYIQNALEKLGKMSETGAELDAKARHPPPRCHPGTRQRLLFKAMEWVEHYTQDDKEMMWLHGVAGVGKSAFAQTFAEHAQKKGLLGGTFFFSRRNYRNDPSRVFLTIANQLASINKDYEKELGQVLANDINLLTDRFPVQFEELIMKPLQHVTTTKKLLVVLDGLDECSIKGDQSEIVEIILRAVNVENTLPILWIICSRPERHLKHLMIRDDVQELCWIEELPLGTKEDKDDMALYIRDEFQRIQEDYSIDLDDQWPGEERVRNLIDKSSELFVFAATLMRFIDDDVLQDPESQLEIALSWVNTPGGEEPMSQNPVEQLYDLYQRILEQIPKGMIDDTLLLIHSRMYIFDHQALPKSAQAFANLVGFSKRRYYSALSGLHSVSGVTEDYPVFFYHKSFIDFIIDQKGRFLFDRKRVEANLHMRVTSILNSDLILALLPNTRILSRISLDLTVMSWPGTTFRGGIQNIVVNAVLLFFNLATEEDLALFDFNRLGHVELSMPGEKIELVTSRGRPVPPDGSTDAMADQLIQGLTTSLKEVLLGPPHYTIPVGEVPLSESAIKDSNLKIICDYMFEEKQAALLGCNDRTVLFVAARRKITQATYMGRSLNTQDTDMHIRFFSLQHPSKVWPQYQALQYFVNDDQWDFESRSGWLTETLGIMNQMDGDEMEFSRARGFHYPEIQN